MQTYYLAVDIGASSGRHMLGHLEGNRMILEEIYRFENGMKKQGTHLCWDLEELFSQIKAGIRRCKEIEKIPVSMGIDTWAVDYVLLDHENHILGKTYGYRDSRTDGMDLEVYREIPECELYAKTGIQKQKFNTIYQLMSVKKKHPKDMENAKTFLMLPDYFHYLLTGNKVSDYTNATSTQLVNAHTNTWDEDVIERLGFNREMFLPLSMPGTEVGAFTSEIAEEVGVHCKVVLPATHDTASAVMAVPSEAEHCLYISSGTWSLMGIETEKAICTEESREKNFTNEGGYEFHYRYLKNIMGLWMIQSVRHEWKDQYSFAELCQMAEKEKAFPSRVDVNDAGFLAPESMVNAIRIYCERTGQQVPETAGETAAVIYQSLSDCYAETVKELEMLSGTEYDTIHIVGGGSNASYLNQLTAEKSGKTVLAGPGEATAVGNLMAQMLKAGEFQNLREARSCVKESFEISSCRGN